MQPWTRTLLCVLLVAGVAGAAVPALATPLPDGRHYEMVSPPSKNGADVMTYSARTRAAANGDAVAFLSVTGFGDVRGGSIATEYIGVRSGIQGTNGWATHAITPGNLDPGSLLDDFQGMESRYTGEFSPDLQRAVFLTSTPLTVMSPNTALVPKLFLYGGLLTSGATSPELMSDCPACTSPLAVDPTSQPGFAGASTDFRHVIFESDQSLTPDVAACEPLPFTQGNLCPLHLYEWANGTLRLAGVMPGGDTAPNSQAGQGAMVFSSTGNANRAYTPNTISQDGSRIFFTVRGSGSPKEGSLYMRTGNSTPTPSTVQVNASERTPPDAAQDARYWKANPNGSMVLFTSAEQLTDESGAGLYAYDASKPSGALDNLALLYSGDVGVIGASDDARYVYFVTISTTPRIKVWHDGVVRDIATVTPEDYSNLVSDADFRLTPKLARVTPDGQHLLFVSDGGDAMPHTGVRDSCGGVAGRCLEVYLYDATAHSGAGQLTCASCQQPVNTPANSDATVLFMRGKSASQKESHLNHPISDDGRYVFFSTGEQLVPEDNNGTTQDVYEYDTVEQTVHLISSGAPGSTGSYFMDASRDGHDAFFTTRDQLVGWDVDGNLDLYDARAGGGFPEPGPSSTCHTGDTCHISQGTAAAFASPASSLVTGAGNVRSKVRKARRCPKAKMHRGGRRGTRCVRRKPAGSGHKGKATILRSGRR